MSENNNQPKKVVDDIDAVIDDFIGKKHEPPRMIEIIESPSLAATENVTVSIKESGKLYEITIIPLPEIRTDGIYPYSHGKATRRSVYKDSAEHVKDILAALGKNPDKYISKEKGTYWETSIIFSLNERNITDDAFLLYFQREIASITGKGTREHDD
jgi:hypothetical protein